MRCLFYNLIKPTIFSIFQDLGEVARKQAYQRSVSLGWGKGSQFSQRNLSVLFQYREDRIPLYLCLVYQELTRHLSETRRQIGMGRLQPFYYLYNILCDLDLYIWEYTYRLHMSCKPIHTMRESKGTVGTKCHREDLHTKRIVIRETQLRKERWFEEDTICIQRINSLFYSSRHCSKN